MKINLSVSYGFLPNSIRVFFFFGYSRGGQTFSHEGPHLKNFEAKDRTDWKSKKSLHVADVLFFPLKIGVEQKKIYTFSDVSQSASLFRCKHNKQNNHTTVRLITIHWKCVKQQQVAAKGPSGLRVEQQPFITNYS